MKILESQSAILTNYEVLSHITTCPLGSKRTNRKGPKNYETIRKEVEQYLTTHPSPLSQKPLNYNRECIMTLAERLNSYELAKGELLMIFNLRPFTISVLSAIVEDMAERFTDDQQYEIVSIVAEVLGSFPPEEAPAGAENGHGEQAPVENGAS